MKYLFLGGRDRRGGPIISFPARSKAAEIERSSLTRLLAYLASLPRFVKLNNFSFLSRFCLVHWYRGGRSVSKQQSM